MILPSVRMSGHEYFTYTHPSHLQNNTRAPKRALRSPSERVLEKISASPSAPCTSMASGKYDFSVDAEAHTFNAVMPACATEGAVISWCMQVGLLAYIGRIKSLVLDKECHTVSNTLQLQQDVHPGIGSQ